MAGSPRKRARRAAVAATPLAPPVAHDARAHDAHAHTHAPERAPAPPYAGARGMPPGPQVRHQVDSHEAAQASGFATALQPGVMVRIERLRPGFCAGWVEDVELEEGGVGELYQYVAEEWGGQSYRLTALSADGSAMYVTKMKIAGGPRDEGVPINRAEWDAAARGEDPRAVNQPAAAAPPAAAAGAAGGSGMFIDFLGLFLKEQRESRDHIFQSVRAMTETHGKNTSDLMTALSSQATEARTANSLPAQIGELTKGMAAVEELKQTVLDGQPETEETDPDAPSGLMDVAGKAFVETVMKQQFENKAPQAQVNRARESPRPAPTRTRVVAKPHPQAPPNGHAPPGIPSAKAAQPRQPPN